jgi:hypothetical protein
MKSFDLLTAIHVYEHLPEPKENFACGTAALKENGLALIQLPDPMSQPTDLYVADHCHHFSPATLDRSLEASGLHALKEQNSPIRGEITRAYRKSSIAEGPNVLPSDNRKIHAALSRGEEALLDLQTKGEPCVIFGCGSLGILISQVLRGQVTVFVDDDSATHGTTIAGLPVRSPSELKSNQATVVVAVQPTSSMKVAKQCESLGHQVIVPYLPALDMS